MKIRILLRMALIGMEELITMGLLVGIGTPINKKKKDK